MKGCGAFLQALAPLFKSLSQLLRLHDFQAAVRLSITFNETVASTINGCFCNFLGMLVSNKRYLTLLVESFFKELKAMKKRT